MKLSFNLPSIRSHNRRSSMDPMNRTTYITDISEKQSHARMLKILDSSQGERSTSINASMCVGNEAKLEFLDTYFHLPLISERNKIENIEDTPHVAYLEEIDKMHIKPQPFGIIRRKGPSTFIDIHMFSMGDTYAGAFSKGVKQYKEVTNLNLKANRLTDLGCEKILSQVHSKKVKSVNVSENKLGRKSILKIIELVSDHETRLKTLELENINISERALVDLCKCISDNKTLKSLNLSKNSLSYMSCESLKEMLKYNSSLIHLDLHWNSIRTEGAKLLFEGLSQNDTLTVLDLSWNSLGRESSQDSIKSLGLCLKQNTTLRHLDLSYNNLTKSDCEIFANLLKDNHELIGLHMLGNECSVNSQGFVVPSEQSQSSIQQGHFFNRILDKSKYSRHQQVKINCWICEKWVEMLIEWKPGDSTQEPKFVHLDTDGYAATPLIKGKADKWSITRVVPPGRVLFYFSNHISAFTSKSFETVKLEKPVPPNGTLKEVSLVNCVLAKGEECRLKDLFGSRPRVNFAEPGVASVEYERIPWSLAISAFASYVLETEELRTECFEFDWNNTKLVNLIKDEVLRDQAKMALRKKYEHLLECFKTLSAMSGSEVFAIGSNVLNDFLGQCKVFDNNFTLSDVGITWNSTNSKTSQANNSGNGLCRYEFLEMLARIANDKYIRNKLSPNITEAIEKLFSDHLESILDKYDTCKWRREVYMTEEVDYFLRAHKPLLEHIYKRFSGQEGQIGQKQSMNLSEFRSLCMRAELINEEFTSREIDVCFSRAMMLQVDYLSKSRHLEMNYVEFLEGLSRAANELSGNDLRAKLESIVPKLLKVCSQNFLQGYTPPTEETYFNLMYKIKGN